VPSSVENRVTYRVREPFSASFTCERENAQSACLPIRPMSLNFNAPVPRKQAEGIRLVPSGGGSSIQPQIEGEGADADSVVSSISFPAPLAEQTRFTLELPHGLRDTSGRTLRNADIFPLKVATGARPPLAKFAAAPFGVVERLAEPGGVALMPVTVRNVEPALAVQALTPGRVSDLNPKTDAEIIAWYQKVQRYDNYTVDRGTAAKDLKSPLPRKLDKDDTRVQTRMVSLLGGQPGVKTLDMPKAEPGDPRPFEVVGIPLTPGFHVLEIASQKLGSALLDARYGDSRTMVVRTSVLATNLGVHFKLGRDNAMAWVTTLDGGAVVPGAQVQVSDCRGQLLASGTTDAQGVVALKDLSPEPPRCSGDDGYQSAYFVSARARDAKGVEDLAFTWSDWQRGIEPWRFNLPTSRDPVPDQRMHTVMDRTLLRAGEAVSMKHYVRTETRNGFGLPTELPRTLIVTHVGSGQQFTQPLVWRTTGTGGRSSESMFQIPPAAKLGMYQVELQGPGREGTQSINSGMFRVEEFRLPVLQGRIAPADKKPLVKATTVPVDVQINYVAGGGAANLPVRVSALVRGKSVSFSDYEAFNFSPPRVRKDGEGANSNDEEATSSQDQRVVADKLPLNLDKNGAGKVVINDVPLARQPQELLLEATYADPNGEVQTLRNTAPL